MNPETCWRFAVRESTSRETWRFLELPLDDLEAARLGWNVIGPALHLGALPSLEREELIRLARRSRKQLGEQAHDFARLMARVPRITCPGYDVDGEDARATFELAERIVAAELDRGWRLRAAASSGLERPGIHLEFAPAEPGAERPDLLRVMMRRAGLIAREAGLIPAPGSNTSRDGVAESWIIPGADPKAAKLDLKPMNKGEQGRQGLFRPLGGLSKSRERRKSLIAELDHGSASPISLAMLAEAPEPLERSGDRDGAIKVARKRRAQFEPLTPASSDILPLISALERLHRSGDNHDLRLALCAVAQQNRILTRAAWTQAIGRAWGDLEDARAAWHSTADRLKLELPCRGATWLRRRLGSQRIADLALAIAEVADRPFADVLARFGRPVAEEATLEALRRGAEALREKHRKAQELEHGEIVASCDCDGETEHGTDGRCKTCLAFARSALGELARQARCRALGLEMTEDKPDWLEQRIKNAGRCLRYEQREECVGCDGELTSQRMRCDWLEACQACAIRYLTALEAELSLTWRDAGPILVLERRGFETRDEAIAWARDVVYETKTGDRALVIPHVGIEGWRITMLARDDRHALGRQAMLPYLESEGSTAHRECSAAKAARLVSYAIASSGATLRQLAESGRGERAVEVARELYRRRRAYLNANGLPWPSTAKVLESFRPDRENTDPDLCDCPANAGERYIYSCCRSRREIARSRERKSLAELIRIHDRMLESGELTEPIPRARSRRSVAIRE